MIIKVLLCRYHQLKEFLWFLLSNTAYLTTNAVKDATMTMPRSFQTDLSFNRLLKVASSDHRLEGDNLNMQSHGEKDRKYEIRGS